jgi:tetratricopeptide (TPR) repeat protein
MPPRLPGAQARRGRAAVEVVVKNLDGADAKLTMPAAAPLAPRVAAQRANDRGLQLYRERRYDEAEAAFTEALKLQPRFALAANNLGFVYFKRGKPVEAARWFEQAIDMDGSRALAYLNLGDAHLQAGNDAKALAAYTTFVGLAPKHPRVAALQAWIAAPDAAHRPQLPHQLMTMTHFFAAAPARPLCLPPHSACCSRAASASTRRRRQHQQQHAAGRHAAHRGDLGLRARAQAAARAAAGPGQAQRERRRVHHRHARRQARRAVPLGHQHDERDHEHAAGAQPLSRDQHRVQRHRGRRESVAARGRRDGAGAMGPVPRGADGARNRARQVHRAALHHRRHAAQLRHDVPRPVEVRSAAKPEIERKFWFEADPKMLEVARSIRNVDLANCSAGKCLARKPQLVIGGNGVSGQAFMDNMAYREYTYKTFQANVLDMETAAVGMVAYSNGVPYIAFRSLSDLAGGGDGENEMGTFMGIAADNSAKVMLAFLAAWK